MDPYEILGVDKSASQDDIKKAFRKKALKHHPDKGGDENKFKQVNEAYSMISNVEKRSRHDASADGLGFEFGFQGHGFPFGDMFGDIFGQQKAEQKPKTTRDEDIVFNMSLNLRQVKQGLKQKVNFERIIACKFCDGEGGEEKRSCGPCRGRGVTVTQPNPYTFQQKTCYHCRGSGVTFKNMCGACNGSGYGKVRDSISISIKEI